MIPYQLRRLNDAFGSLIFASTPAIFSARSDRHRAHRSPRALAPSLPGTFFPSPPGRANDLLHRKSPPRPKFKNICCPIDQFPIARMCASGQIINGINRECSSNRALDNPSPNSVTLSRTPAAPAHHGNQNASRIMVSRSTHPIAQPSIEIPQRRERELLIRFP